MFPLVSPSIPYESTKRKYLRVPHPSRLLRRVGSYASTSPATAHQSLVTNHFFAALFFVPGFARSATKNSFVGRVLITSFFSSHPRRAITTPYRINARFPALCESVEITTFTP